MEQQTSSKAKHYVSRVIKLRLEKLGGSATFPLIRENTTIRWADEDHDSIIFDAIGPTHRFSIELFDEVLHKANELGGEMYIASQEARAKGTRLGNGVPINSIDGFIALTYNRTPIGHGVLATGNYVAALLVWLGVCVYKHTTIGRYIRTLERFKEL